MQLYIDGERSPVKTQIKVGTEISLETNKIQVLLEVIALRNCLTIQISLIRNHIGV